MPLTHAVSRFDVEIPSTSLAGEPIGQQPNVKNIDAISCFPISQQVKQQGANPGLLQNLGHMPVPWAQATAAAAVRKEHKTDR